MATRNIYTHKSKYTYVHIYRKRERDEWLEERSIKEMSD